jgi:hypothetical protein
VALGSGGVRQGSERARPRLWAVVGGSGLLGLDLARIEIEFLFLISFQNEVKLVLIQKCSFRAQKN